MMLYPDLPQNTLHVKFMKAIHCVKSVSIQTFSGPYFPAFWLNTEYWYCIQSECRKIQTRKTLNMDTFQAVVKLNSGENDLKTLIIMQIFNKEYFFLILLWMYSLCIVIFETSTFFHITGSDDVIFLNNWWNLGLFLRIAINPELVIVWGWMTTHFKQKPQFWG